MGPSWYTVVQSVEVVLDDELDSAVRAQWARLREAGLDSQGRIRAETNRPHVTLFVAQAVPPELDETIRAAVGPLPVPIRLGGIVVFGSRRVTLARAVVPSADLLAVHARVYDALRGCPGVPEHIRPGDWTPHVTLARRVPAHDLGRAVVTAGTRHAGESGSVTAVRRWDGTAKREWFVAGMPGPARA